jgi:hypothetical protein
MTALPRFDRPRGPEAARLRQRKYELLRRFSIPEDALPGSLTLTHTRCGRASCHCAEGEGHPVWRLRFLRDGKPHLENIPAEWAEAVQRRVEAGRAVQEALREVLGANAELLVLERAQHVRRQRAAKKSPHATKKTRKRK